MKDKIFISIFETVEFLGKAIGINIYGGAPIIESGTVSPSVIVGPSFVFPIDTDARIDNFWVWSDDFDLVELPDGKIFYRVTDNLGCYKYFQYDTVAAEFVINSGWAATVNSEGTIIIHGPRNDPRGEIAIPVPFGYGIDLVTGDLPYYDWREEGQTRFWRNKTGENGIPYFTMDFRGGFLGVVPQHWSLELAWSPEEGTPYVTTTLYNDGVDKYDIKEFATTWYKNSEPMDTAEIFVVVPPDEHFSPGYRSLLGYIPDLLGNLIELYESGESDQFDAYRNPDDIP